ncbi:hypothetical protein [Providencia sneebia]|uniref:Uncharacterized protein n=1 Tax=Providencia sneebia DSM 19967 TaxID=1141660 RepID=K8WH42_9GAMM|nr:hypothetical protein [Providencia sneebia]EKT55580.1 hypothetical protein OO7_11369 [Providencia sneebia DSM 19967]
MQLRLGTITIHPDDEQINIPVDIYKGEEFITGAPLANIVYQSTFNSSKPLAEYYEEAKDHALNVIKQLNP